MQTPPLCLTIAGSDPSGGAGIQGDLKTFAAHGAYGMAVITALTAQNTCGVSGAVGVEPAFVREQLDRIYEDIPTPFVKTGMLFTRGIVEAVADFFESRPETQLVVDPVMVSSSGAELLQPDAVDAYKTRLIPMVAVLTPNNLEARLLTGIDVKTIEDAIAAGETLRRLGARNVVVKGGDVRYGEGDSLFDVLCGAAGIKVFERPIRGNLNSHGTGCAMAAAIVCNMAAGRSVAEAVDAAGEYVGRALENAYPTGKGSGSINHLWNVSSRTFDR